MTDNLQSNTNEPMIKRYNRLEPPHEFSNTAMEYDYHIAKYILNVTRYKETIQQQNECMHTEFSKKKSKNSPNLLKSVLTKQFLNNIEKQYPVTFTMTLYPHLGKDALVEIVQGNKDRACIEMKTIYHIDISEYVNKI